MSILSACKSCPTQARARVVPRAGVWGVCGVWEALNVYFCKINVRKKGGKELPENQAFRCLKCYLVTAASSV